MRRVLAMVLLAAVALCLAGCQDEARVRAALIDMGYMPADGGAPSPDPTPAPQPSPMPQLASIERVTEIPEGASPVTEVRLNESELSLKKGKSFRLQATVLPDNAADKKTKFSSSDKKVCTVGRKGKVTARGKGTATITCTAGGVSAQCQVTVE